MLKKIYNFIISNRTNVGVFLERSVAVGKLVKSVPEQLVPKESQSPKWIR